MKTSRTLSAVIFAVLAASLVAFLKNVKAQDAVTNPPPAVDVWYGSEQVFGQRGNPQKYINILGNVSDPDGVVSLVYSLNGGPDSTLSIGGDGRRLVSYGDFNVDILSANLVSGPNLVVIKAVDRFGNQTAKTVTVTYVRGNTWSQPYTINWGSVTNIQDVAQVVDGLWTLEANGIRTAIPGYDRLVAIGDTSWTDYEVTVPITVHRVDFKSSPGVGVLVRWMGHTDNPVSGWQPKSGWIPFGAIGWFRWEPSGLAKLEIYGTEASASYAPVFETRYILKMRVETTLQGGLYSLKVWSDGLPEPSGWNLQAKRSELQHGSFMLIAHYVDASFGDVTVTPLIDEYKVDENTVALYHFNGDLNDSGPNRLHLTAAGNARLVSDNLGWMRNPSGQVLRTTDLGDQVTVSIPDSLMLPGTGASPITLEAWFHPRAYRAYSVGNYPIISLNQDWDTRLEVLDGKWNSPRVPTVIVGNQTIVSSDMWGLNVPLNTWHFLRITFGALGTAEVYVDGKLLGTKMVSMNYGRFNDWVLTLGNFDGDVDEVRVSDAVRAGGAAKPAVTALLSEGTGTEAASEGLTFGVDQNYPNPFNPSTTIRYTLPEASRVRLTVYNVLGQQVRSLVEAVQGPGAHSVMWDGRDAFGRTVATGVYLYRLEGGSNAAVRKMIFAK